MAVELTEEQKGMIRATIEASNNRFKARELADKDWFSDGEGDILVSPFIQGVAPMDVTDGQINFPRVFDGDRWKTSPVEKAEPKTDVPALGQPAQLVIPTAERWKAVQIYADLETSINAADRDFRLEIVKTIATTGLLALAITTNIRLTATQDGSIYMAEGKDATFLNDNGAVTTEDTNITPATFDAGDEINAVADLIDIGDQVRLLVHAIVTEL